MVKFCLLTDLDCECFHLCKMPFLFFEEEILHFRGLDLIVFLYAASNKNAIIFSLFIWTRLVFNKEFLCLVHQLG